MGLPSSKGQINCFVVNKFVFLNTFESLIKLIGSLGNYLREMRKEEGQLMLKYDLEY